MHLAAFWNDRRARIAALLIIGGGISVFAVEVAPILGGVFDMISPGLTALLALVGLVGAVVLMFPGWWPLWRARRTGLANPWVFALVTWGFTTAALQALAIVVLVPLAVFKIFFLPQLDAMGLLSAEPWRLVGAVIDSWWIGLPLLQLFMAVAVTRALGRRWTRIDLAVREGQPE